MRTYSRIVLAGAAMTITAALVSGCGDGDLKSTNDRRYCLDTVGERSERRVEDRYCETVGEPRYVWVWVEKRQYVPAYYAQPGYRYYRHPVNRRGQRITTRPTPTRAGTTAPPTSTRPAAPPSSRAVSTKGSGSTKGSTGSGSTKGSTGSKGSSGSKGSTSSKRR